MPHTMKAFETLDIKLDLPQFICRYNWQRLDLMNLHENLLWIWIPFTDLLFSIKTGLLYTWFFTNRFKKFFKWNSIIGSNLELNTHTKKLKSSNNFNQSLKNTLCPHCNHYTQKFSISWSEDNLISELYYPSRWNKMVTRLFTAMASCRMKNCLVHVFTDKIIHKKVILNVRNPFNYILGEFLNRYFLYLL